MERTGELTRRIRELAARRKAIIIAHNYQRAEVQDVADVTGDSLGLSRIAASSDAEVIVFCGVHFMAESAAILAPSKKVLLPRMDAGCPMADMITAENVREIKSRHPGVPIVTYVNSSAEVKAESDICCTSANVVTVTKSTKAPVAYLAPDRNLARWAARHTSQKILYWEGFCPTHERMTVGDVQAARALHPGAPFIAHPECRPEVLDLADEVRSTSGMIDWCAASGAATIIVGTETGLFHRLKKDSPDKTFVAPSEKLVCPNMKLTTLEDVAEVLETMENVVAVSEKTRAGALAALRKMLEAGRD